MEFRGVIVRFPEILVDRKASWSKSPYTIVDFLHSKIMNIALNSSENSFHSPREKTRSRFVFLQIRILYWKISEKLIEVWQAFLGPQVVSSFLAVNICWIIWSWDSNNVFCGNCDKEWGLAWILTTVGWKIPTILCKRDLRCYFEVLWSANSTFDSKFSLI